MILVVGAALRLTAVNWDDYHHFHPDERFITWVATTIEWPSTTSSALSPHESTLNPYYWPPEAKSDGILVPQDEQRDFAYGHLPLYLGVGATKGMEWLGIHLADKLPADWLLTRDLLNGSALVEYRHLTAVSRTLTALFDLGTIVFLFLLGQQLYDVKVGLLAAAFLAVNVMHIQLAHFFAFDPYMTFFVVGAIYFMVWEGKRTKGQGASATKGRGKGKSLLMAAIFVGLAIGSKFAAILLFLPLALTIWSVKREKWVGWLITAVFISATVFFITNPFAVLDFSCEVIVPARQFGFIQIPAIDYRSCFLDNISTQSGMVRGTNWLPFTRQYSGTTPYLYFIEMQLKWGMGPLLGIVVFIGFLKAIYDLRITNYKLSTINYQLSIVLAWCIPFFLTTGSFQVKFMRYLLPLTPFLMLFGAALIVQMPWKRWRWGVATAVFATTFLFALSFVNMYRQPHPWIAASEWIYENVSPGDLILSEKWDDSLPFSLPYNGKNHSRSEYENFALTWLTRTGDRDDKEKLAENLAQLADAEYLVLSSNRVYGVVPRLPEIYPLSSQYHQLLFDGTLGYEPQFIADRAPQLGGVRLQADTFDWPRVEGGTAVNSYLNSFPHLNWGRADESFTVYDQPLTIIFKNKGHLTAGEMAALFEQP